MWSKPTITRKGMWARIVALSALVLCIVVAGMCLVPDSQALAKSSNGKVPFVGNTLKTKKGDPQAVALGAFGKMPTKYSVILGSTTSYKADDDEKNAVDANAQGTGEVVSAIPASVLPNPTTEEFIAAIGEQAREIADANGLYASVMIAQAILESGSGGSGLSKPPYNNLFGIKGSYKGSAVYMLTSEDDGTGNRYDIVAAFRSYPSTRESLEDYAFLLTKSMGDFYSPAWKANAATYVDACNYLQGHYATSTSYSSSLQGLIIAYDLEQFDHPSDAEGFVAAGEDHARGMFAAVPIGGANARSDSWEDATSSGDEQEDAVEGSSADAPAAEAIAEAPESGDATLGAISAFAKSPVGQVTAFAACPVAVLLVLLVRGGGGSIVLPSLSTLPARLSERIALLLAR